MNKLLLSALLSSALFMTGCSKTTAFDFFSTDVYYEKAVSNMQTASLMKEKETKALIHAVYLNRVDPQTYKGEENFYVSIHIINDKNDPKERGLNNSDYTLKIVEKSPSGGENIYLKAVDISELEEEDKLLYTMPAHNRWSHFYLVKYKELNTSTLTLSFEHALYGKSELKFKKDIIE